MCIIIYAYDGIVLPFIIITIIEVFSSSLIFDAFGSVRFAIKGLASVCVCVTDARQDLSVC